MAVKTTVIPGVLEVRPDIHGDDRGWFAEMYRGAELEDHVGHRVHWAQGNVSVSRARTVRGIHYSIAPAGQAKYVTCQEGMVWDVFMDLRPDSPSFGSWGAVTLTAEDANAVYIPEGVGHGFLAMTDARVSYLVSTPYNPETEHGINPYDPVLGINWCGVIDPLLSEKDRTAPSFQEMEEKGLLPRGVFC